MKTAANRQMDAQSGTRMRMRTPRDINLVRGGDFSRSYCDRTVIAMTAAEQETYHAGSSESLALWTSLVLHLRFSACFTHRMLTSPEVGPSARMVPRASSLYSAKV